MTDPTPTTPETLRDRLRLHAYDLVNGGTNATDLRNDLNAAAAALAASERTQAALRAALRDLLDAIPDETRDADPPLGAWMDIAEAALRTADALPQPTNEENADTRTGDTAPAPAEGGAPPPLPIVICGTCRRYCDCPPALPVPSLSGETRTTTKTEEAP